MVFFKAQQMQRLAELLQRIQKAIEGEGGDLEKAEEDMRELARTAGLDLEIARMADAATLEGVLTAGGRDTESRRWLAAEVLFVDGLLALRKGEPGLAGEEGARPEASGDAADPIDATAAEAVSADVLDRLKKARHLYLTLPDALDLPEDAVQPKERLLRIAEMEPEISP